MKPVFRVDHSGNATTDQANVSAAIASANALTRGGMVYLPGGLFTLSGGFTLNSDVCLCGDGRGQTQINHTGNNVLFTFASGGGGFRGIISNIQLWSTQGASGTAASAIQIRNHYAQGVSNVEVGNYQANCAIDIHNDVTYAEGASPDPRSYRVDFGKFARAFPDFRFAWTAQTHDVGADLDSVVDEVDATQFSDGSGGIVASSA